MSATLARVALAFSLRSGGRDRDLQLDACEDVSIAELCSAIAEHCGIDDHGLLFTDRLGRLGGNARLAESGLRNGDLVSMDGPLAPRIASPLGTSGPVVTLVTTGGPAAGTRVALGPGRYSVGRDPEADIVIDDPSLSRAHFAVEVGRDATVVVADAGSSNGTAIEGNGIPGGTSHPVEPGQAVEAGRSTFAVEPGRGAPRDAAQGAGPTIGFNRQPRVSRGYEPPALRLDPPPTASRAIRIPFVVAMVPLFMGVAVYLVTKSPLMLMMGAFSPVMMIGSAMSTRRSGAKEHGEQVAAHAEAATELRRQLAEARAQEQSERRASAPHAGDLAARALEHLPALWERRPSDRDFVDVRIGLADQPTIVQTIYLPGGDPALRIDTEVLIAQYQTVPVVPVLVRSSEIGTIGVVGSMAAGDGLARWIMVQHATLQSPRDVVIAAALSHERAEAWRWLSWLPHTGHPASPIEGEHVAVGEHAARDLLRGIATIAGERREEGERRSRTRRRTTIVLLIDEDVAPEATVIDELLDGCSEVDIVAVWMGRERRYLPGACGVIVEAAAERAVADVTWTATGRRVEEASVDAVAPAIADRIARSLAPLEDTTAGGAATAVPRSVPLVELLDLGEPTPDRIAARWAKRSGDALDAVIGVSADGPFSLDLRTDGPHALVAGTTGAGKSELLQSWIASLACTHPPDRISFLLVDYKGGAAFKDCAHLPHCVGMVTDLDAHQVQRALISLNAELRRREHVLADAGARDLIELERRAPGEAPPNLVIVIDEFATLAKEVPEFVAGVVDVAQRGRSLGVHVVLATQRPGNAVTDNIRANTSLRLALRVAGVAESDDVLGAPDAARLPKSVPGRVLAKTGPTDLILFQAGYVGGHTSAATAVGRIEVRDIVPQPAVTTRGGSPIHDEITDLELIVAAAQGATEDLGIAPPPSPWLPALEPAVALSDAQADRGDGAAAGVVIGTVDEPTRQRRVPLTIDLARDGSLLVFGASGSGKTTVLRTLACALAQAQGPRELQLFGLDFAGLGLGSLEALPHCGSVVPGDDQERVTRLINTMRRTIDERSRRFSAARVADLAGYNAAHPDEPLPRLVVLLDSYAGFVETYERVDLGALVDAMPRVIAEGRAAGVHVVVSGDRRNAIPNQLASLVSNRLILRMSSDDEYQSLGLDARELRGAVLPPGRCFLGDRREAQVATLSGSGEAAEEARAIEVLGARLSARTTHRATPIEQLPLDVPAAVLAASGEPFSAPLALDDLDLSTITASVSDSHFLILGPYRSGRSTALHTLATGLRESTPGLTVHLLAPRRSSIITREGWDSVARGVEECQTRVAELLDDLVTGAADGDEEPDPVLLVIDDGGELFDSTAEAALELILKRGRDGHVRVVASLETGHARHYMAWVKELRKDGRGMILDPNLDLDGELLGARLPRRTNAVFPPGRGYVVIDGRIHLGQVARA